MVSEEDTTASLLQHCSDPLVFCGIDCAARFFSSSVAPEVPVRAVSLANRPGDGCQPCRECGLVLASPSCSRCRGAGCGAYDWDATRQAAECRAALRANGRSADTELASAARHVAVRRPGISGARLAELLGEADAFVDACLEDLA